MKLLAGVVTFYVIGLISGELEEPAWGYQCQQNRCVKVEITPENLNSAVSLPVCRIFCNDEPGTLWPKPTGPVKLGQYLVRININNIEIKKPYSEQSDLWNAAEKRFREQIFTKVQNADHWKTDGRPLVITVSLDSVSTKLNMDTDESYKLVLSQGKPEVFANIKASTFYGARHALETLSQLIVYDDIRNEVQVVAEGEINDAPVYKHRGVVLDTSRNYISVKAIKRTIDAMAMTKLNVFHWHITDSQSFPVIIKSRPELAKYGAYSPKKVYTAENVADIINYGRIRGVQVIPEFDAPAHVGEGWQKYNMTACFNKQPWEQFCVEPPCGQLDPTVDALYDVLEDIYREMLSMFGNPEIFHMGGDEVSTACWNTSERIRTWMVSKGWGLEKDDFMKLWGHFQNNALSRLDKITGTQLPIIMWTSGLTEKPYAEKYLNKDRYIIQIWTTGHDQKVQELLKLGYKLILSNYDALYFDCGGGGWVNEGQNWCSPYISWHKVYMNRPDQIGGKHASQILGAEAAIWTEQIDEQNLDSRFWPRASAMAERLWSNPKASWREAESRFLIHREWLVENGIAAEALEPLWCLQNQGECPIVKN